jgi:uncharacterized protein
MPAPRATTLRRKDHRVFLGAGTALNVATVLVGGGLGLLVGARLPRRVQEVVTDGLGLVVLVIGGLDAASVTDEALRSDVGRGTALIVVLLSVLLGGVVGSGLRLQQRLEHLGDVLVERITRRRDETSSDASVAPADPAHPAAQQPVGLTPAEDPAADQLAPAAYGGSTHRAVEGFVTASLVFCVGPLTVLGSLQDGLGQGVDLLALKATLDGFAALAFAAALGWGVLLSAGTVLVVQGALTLLGAGLGQVLSPGQLAALTATGGVLLLGVGLRLLRVKQVAVADLLPALLVAPLLVLLVTALR